MLPADTLLDDVCCADPVRVAAALQAAHGRGEELAPGLLSRLQSVVTNMESWTAENGPFPGFLFFLAAEFRLTAAHEPMLAILQLDEKHVDRLLADVVTGGACTALADTYPGDPTPLLALIENQHAGPFARGAGLRALAQLWKRGRISREDLLGWMLRLAAALDPDHADDLTAADQLVDAAVQVHAFEIRDTILGLYERGLASPGYFEIEYTEKQLQANAPDASETASLDDSVDNAWAYLEGWAFFDPPPPPKPEPTTDPFIARKRTPPAEPKVWSPPTPFRSLPKVGRNDPCPCGSGKKHKKCCGA